MTKKKLADRLVTAVFGDTVKRQAAPKMPSLRIAQSTSDASSSRRKMRALSNQHFALVLVRLQQVTP